MPLVEPSALELKTIRALANFSDQRVIEIGAGDGRLAWPLAPEAALWIALDPDTDELGVAADDLPKKNIATVHLIVGDGQTLCFPDESFDLALFTWSLCCIPEKSAAITEAYRVLRPGGHLLDVHATDEPTALEVWHARYQAQAQTDFLKQPENLEAIHRVPVGYVDHAGPPHGSAATDALIEALDADTADAHGFNLQRSTTFDYRYFFDSLDELTDYFDENHEQASLSDALLERALTVMTQATTTPKLVIVQRVAVTALRKI